MLLQLYSVRFIRLGFLKAVLCCMPKCAMNLNRQGNGIWKAYTYHVFAIRVRANI
jgi:hypothetical protein